jgi:transcriptional regulator with XRE-family HTH domain
MKKYNNYDDLWKDLENDETYIAERNILEFTLQLHQLKEKKRISNKQLAEKVGVSSAYITKVFNGKANFTIATMTKLCRAIGGKIVIHVIDEKEQNPKWFRAIEGQKRPISRWIHTSSDSITIHEFSHHHLEQEAA